MGAWEFDLTTGAMSWTSGVFDLFGIHPGDRFDRRDIVALYEPGSRGEMERLRADAIARCGGFTMDARIVRADGTPRWMRLTATTEASSGRATRLYGIKQDITDERRRWDALRDIAERDAVTGVANRAVFQAQFLDMPAAVRTHAPIGALLLFDVDGFKQVNDTHGHAAGDACLAAVATRLSRGFPDAVMIARIGGDEFAVLIPAGPAITAVEAAVRAQIVRLAEPIAWRGGMVRVSVSVGIAPTGNPCRPDAEALFVAADAALYRAKQAGRNTSRTAGPREPIDRASVRRASLNPPAADRSWRGVSKTSAAPLPSCGNNPPA